GGRGGGRRVDVCVESEIRTGGANDEGFSRHSGGGLPCHSGGDAAGERSVSVICAGAGVISSPPKIRAGCPSDGGNRCDSAHWRGGSHRPVCGDWREGCNWRKCSVAGPCGDLSGGPDRESLFCACPFCGSREQPDRRQRPFAEWSRDRE